MTLLTIIPARCGSKEILKKNIMDVCGKPLLYYTVAPALELLKKKLSSHVIVSTDCEEIAGIAREIGADVPFLRPDELSSDTAPSIAYVLHALEHFEKKGDLFDAVLILQPTSPLRTFQDMHDSIELFRTRQKDSLISVYKEKKITDLIIYREDNGIAIPLNEKHNKGIRRQDQSQIFIRNGAIYMAKTEYVKKTGRLVGNRPLLYEMPESRSINIDTVDDLQFVRRVLCG